MGLESGHGPCESGLGVVVLVDALLLAQALLCPLHGGLGALAVYLLGVFGEADEQYDIVGLDLDEALADGGGRIVTIDRLCEAAWGDNPFGYENSLMAHIRRIREKIEADPSHPVSLITVKGLGYRLLTEGR